MRGRGTAWRILPRFEPSRREREGCEPGPESADAADDLPPTRTQVREEVVRSILSSNNSPDVPFELSINPYRGCEHGCIYCYARPTHSYLDLSPGLDFETQLVAKVNAVEALRTALCKPGYRPQAINIGSVTDAYQPIEREHRLTRGLLELLLSCAHPCTLVTKSGGIVRDLDLLAPLAAQGLLLVFVSVTTLDPALSRILEPRASAPARRLSAIRALARAGVWVGVNVAPIIPFINEPEIEAILEAASLAGARSAHWTVVRLPWEVNPLFQQWLEDHFPQRAARVMARIREMRGGQDYDADFRQRMKGEGLWAELIRQRMLKGAERVGLVRETPSLVLDQFRPPAGPQACLF